MVLFLCVTYTLRRKVEPSVTPSYMAQDAVQRLRSACIHVIGAVLSQVNLREMSSSPVLVTRIVTGGLKY